MEAPLGTCFAPTLASYHQPDAKAFAEHSVMTQIKEGRSVEGESTEQGRGIIVIILLIIFIFAAVSWWGGEDIEIKASTIPHIKQMCNLKDICSDYKIERFNCSTAGSYEKCMSIRMTQDRYSTAKSFCSDDGNIQYSEKGVPNFIQCLLVKYEK